MISREREKLKDMLDMMNYAYLNNEKIYSWENNYKAIREFIYQPIKLDKDVEEAIRFIEAFASIEEKNNFYRDIDDTPQWGIIKRELTNNRKDIDMLISKKNILLGNNQELQSKLNAIEEVVNSVNFGIIKLDSIKQIIGDENNER